MSELKPLAPSPVAMTWLAWLASRAHRRAHVPDETYRALARRGWLADSDPVTLTESGHAALYDWRCRHLPRIESQQRALRRRSS